MRILLLLFIESTLTIKLQTSDSYAQQDPLFSQNQFERSMINPAYAGSTNSIAGILGYRQQLAGLDGAPQTQVFGIHSPILKKSMGIGLKAVHDNIGVTGQTSVSAIYAYHLRLSKGKLSFGLEGGLLNQSVDFPILIKTDADDPLLQNKESIMLPDAAFGAYYYSDRFFLGASMYHLLQSELNYSDSPRTPVARFFGHSLITGGYRIDAGENIYIEPLLLIKYVTGAPIQTDISMNITYKEMFTLGGGYRTGAAIIFLFNYKIKDRINIGYAYDYTISKLSSYDNGSHEIMLGYNIRLKERVKKPVEPIEEPVYEEYITEVSPEDTLPEEEYITEVSPEDTLPDEDIIAEVSPEDTTSLAVLEEMPVEEIEALAEGSPTPALPEGEGEPTREKTSMGAAKFEGVVKSNGFGLQGVSLKLIKGTEVVSEIKTSENGEFSFDVSEGSGYWVFITKEGYVDRFSEISSDKNKTLTGTYELEKLKL